MMRSAALASSSHSAISAALDEMKSLSAEGKLGPEPTIPHSFQPMDSDTPKQKLIKAKHIKRLRFEHRRLYEESEQKRKSQSWRSFIGKESGGRPVKRAKLAPKQSIFSTSDSIGSKVGVTGSGREVTQVRQREKIKWDANADAPAEE